MASMQTKELVTQSLPPGSRMAEENAALLRQMPLFAAVPEEAVRALAAVAKQVSVEAKDTLFNDGDPGDRVFFVCSGEVEIYLTNAAKTKIPLEIEKAGDFFGEVGALSGSRRSAAARALQKTLALVVSGEEWKKVLRAHPDILLAMYTRTTRRLGRTSIDLRRTTVTDPAQLFREQMSEGERQVRAVAQFCGSLKMLGLNAIFVVAWAIIVWTSGKNPLDGVPFNALALVLTLEAIAITCIVLHSQNLQEKRESYIKSKETEANIRTEAAVTNLDEKLNLLRSELLQRLPPPANTVTATPPSTHKESNP